MPGNRHTQLAAWRAVRQRMGVYLGLCFASSKRIQEAQKFKDGLCFAQNSSPECFAPSRLTLDMNPRWGNALGWLVKMWGDNI